MEYFQCPFQLYVKDYLCPHCNWLLKRRTFGSPFTSRCATFVAGSGQINCFTFYHIWLAYEFYFFWLTFLPTPPFGSWWLNRCNSAQVGLVLDRPDFMQKSVLYSSWGPDIDLLQKLTLNMRGSKYVILVSTRHQWLSVPAWDQQNLPDVGLRSAPHLQSARPLLTVNYITTSVSR